MIFVVPIQLHSVIDNFIVVPSSVLLCALLVSLLSFENTFYTCCVHCDEHVSYSVNMWFVFILNSIVVKLHSIYKRIRNKSLPPWDTFCPLVWDWSRTRWYCMSKHCTWPARSCSVKAGSECCTQCCNDALCAWIDTVSPYSSITAADLSLALLLPVSCTHSCVTSCHLDYT